MESKFKIGDEVVCVDREEDCWYRLGDRLIVSSEAFKKEGNTCFNIVGEPKRVWIIEDHFELLNKEKEGQSEYSVKHYDTFYYLTDKDLEEGKIKVDAYFVAKQWKVGSKDDSGALFHNLKTIARFGEKNSIDREIKALYNQTLALARIYGVSLE